MSSRVEELLAAAVDGSGTDGLDPPQSRNEKLLFALNDKLDNVESALAGKVDGPADGQAYQQLVTDGDGNVKWEDRLAYGGEETITWDGNIEGLACVELAPDYTFYKVSDLYFDRDLLESFSYTTSNGLSFSGGKDETAAMAESVWGDNGASIMVVTEPCTLHGVVIPESGLYVVASRSTYVNKLTISFGKKIDKMFIPAMDSVTLSSSTFGSSKKFKITIDDTGTISATEVT